MAVCKNWQNFAIETPSSDWQKTGTTRASVSARSRAAPRPLCHSLPFTLVVHTLSKIYFLVLLFKSSVYNVFLTICREDIEPLPKTREEKDEGNRRTNMNQWMMHFDQGCEGSTQAYTNLLCTVLLSNQTLEKNSEG